MATIINGQRGKKINRTITYQGKTYRATGYRGDESVLLTPVLPEGVVQDVHKTPCLSMPMSEFLKGNYR